jgi:hypothetical protein
MTVELSVLDNAWQNFVYSYLVDSNPVNDLSDVNQILKPYNAHVIDLSTYTITFDTEQDKAFFLLRWA